MGLKLMGEGIAPVQMSLYFMLVALCCVIGSRLAMTHGSAWYIVLLTVSMLIALQMSYLTTLVIEALISPR
jgi:hypothetical protein